MQNSMQNLSENWFLTLLVEPHDNETRLANVRALLQDFSAEDVLSKTFVALQDSHSKLHAQADTCIYNPVRAFANLLYSFGLMCSISIDRSSVRRILPQLSVMIEEMICRDDTVGSFTVEEFQHVQWCCLATCSRLLHSFISESSELQKRAVHFALQVISVDDVDEHRRPLLLKAVEFIGQLLSSSPIFVGERGPFLLGRLMRLLSMESVQSSSEMFVELCEATGKLCKLLLPVTRPNAVVLPLLKPEQCDADLQLMEAASDSGYESGDDELEGDDDEEDLFRGTLAPSFVRELQGSVNASQVCTSVFGAYERLDAIEGKISVASALPFLARVLVLIGSADNATSALDDCIEFSLEQVQSCSSEFRQHQSVRVLALALLQSTAEMLRESGASSSRWMRRLTRLVLQLRADGCFFERIRDKFLACFSALLLHSPDEPEALVATMFLDEILPVLKDPLIISDSVFALRNHGKILEERLPQLVAYLNIGLTRHSNYSVRISRSICSSLGRIVCYSGAAFVPFLADTTSGVLETVEAELYRAGMDALVACARLLWSAHKHADLLQKDDDAAMSLATSRFFSLLIQILANDVDDVRDDDDSVDVDVQLQNCALEMAAFLIEERVLTPEVENWGTFQELLEHLVSEIAQPIVFEDDIDVRSAVAHLLCSVGRVAQHDSRFSKCMNWTAALEVMERASENGFSYADECVQVLRQCVQS